MTGIFSSRARIFSPRLIWPICSTRLSPSCPRAASAGGSPRSARPSSPAGVQPPRLRAQLEDADVARVVHVQRRARELLGGLQHLRPAVRLTRPLRRSSPLSFACEAMKRCASSVSDISSENSATGRSWSIAGVLGDVRDERRLAHRGARGQHDQVARLEAAGEVVEVLEAGRRAGERDALRDTSSSLSSSSWRTSSIEPQLARAVLVGDPEELGLGLLDQLARRRR